MDVKYNIVILYVLRYLDKEVFLKFDPESIMIFLRASKCEINF